MSRIAKPHYLTKEVIPIAAVNTGDLLGWMGDNTRTYGDKSLKLIRMITGEKFGHVGIAVRMHDGLDDELMVVEATIPKIRITRLTTEKDFYCVPMGVQWTVMNKSFLMSKIGLHYGIADAIRAAMGMRIEHDMTWQCAELAYCFYEASGIIMPEAYTPGKLVQESLIYSKNTLKRVVGGGRAIDLT